MAKTVGLNCELSYNTGTYATPVWSAIDNARDVTLTLEAGEADASSRGSGGWRETIQALKDASIEFEMVSDNGDAAFIAIKDAYFNGTSVDVIALDGPEATAGNEGLRIIAAVSSFSRSEPLEDAVTISVTLKPTPNSDATPAWYTS